MINILKQITCIITSFTLLTAQPVFSQHVQFENIQTNTGASFRGLAVVDDSVAWVSGSKGWVGKSTNGGNDWIFRRVKGFEGCDFRSLYAFDSKKAVIANAGAPAYILLTTDGGLNWKVVYQNNDSAAFFDGIDFWNNKAGVIYGDPIGGHMLLLQTNDGGLTWKELPKHSRPVLEKGEASFAASGTAIRCLGQNKIIIATGGIVSRLLISADKGITWSSVKTPIIQGLNTRGIFSFACTDKHKIIIVGGDYKMDSLRAGNAFFSNDGGKTWCAPLATTRGYRECVEAIDEETLIAAGPGGTDISYDHGQRWQPLSDEEQFHVLRKSRNGKRIIMAGSSGKICVLKL